MTVKKLHSIVAERPSISNQFLLRKKTVRKKEERRAQIEVEKC